MDVSKISKDVMKKIPRLFRKKKRDGSFEYQLSGERLAASSLYQHLKITDYNPDQVLWDKGLSLRLYDRMILDDKIGGVMSLFKSLTLSADWDVKGPHAGVTKKMLEDLSPVSFMDVNHNMLDARQYGFKLAENVWGFRDGLQVVEAIKPKYSHNIRFHSDQFDNLQYFYLSTSGQPGGVPVSQRFSPSEEPGKYVLFVHPYLKDGNWYGTSELQGIYREWWAKDLILKFRNIYLQNFGMPMMLITFDEEMPENMQTELFALCDDAQENFQLRIPGRRNDETGEIIPYAKIEYLEAKRGGDAQYNAALSQLDTAIARKLGIPDKIGFSDSPGGSYNLGQTQYEVILTSIKMAHERMSDMWNQQLVKPFIDRNFGTKRYPRVIWQGLTEGLTETKAKILGMLTQNGVFDPKEPWIRDYLGAPKLPKSFVPSKPVEAPEKDDKDDDKQGGEQPEGPPNQKASPFANKLTVPEPNYIARIDYKEVERVLDAEDSGGIKAFNKLIGKISADIVETAGKKNSSSGHQ